MNQARTALLLGIALIFLGSFVYYQIKKPAPAPAVFDCKVLHDQIETELVDANVCEKDADCSVVSLGGQYTELGCYKYVNKGVNQVKLYEKVERYYNSCYEKIDKCEPLTKPVCVNHRCRAH